MNVAMRFRWLVYLQVLLGIVAFCLAEPNVGMLLLAGTLGLLAWPLAEGPNGRPLPRWTVNLLALAAAGWLGVEVLVSRPPIVTAMGHFTIWLQVLMLYAGKTHRDYAFILTLSVMQMAGASVLGISVVFGAMLVVYCLLALSTALAMYLKTASETVLETHARGAAMLTGNPDAVAGMTDAPDSGDEAASSSSSSSSVATPQSSMVMPVSIRHGKPRHLRTVGIGFSFIIATVAAMVFIAVPRSGERRMPLASMAERLSYEGPNSQTGFSQTVDLDTAPLGGGGDALLNVTLPDAIPGPDGVVLRLRGAALDTYDPIDRQWQAGPWSDAGRLIRMDRPEQSGLGPLISLNEETARSLLDGASEVSTQATTGPQRSATLPNAGINLATGVLDHPDAPAYRGPTQQATIVTRRDGVRHLFAPYPTVQVATSQVPRVQFNPVDHTLISVDRMPAGSSFTVSWPLSQDARSVPDPIRMGPLIVRPHLADDVTRPPRRGFGRPAFNRGRPPFDGSSNWMNGPMNVSQYAQGWPGDVAELRQIAEDALAQSGLEPQASVARQARALADWLRERCQYSLSNPTAPEGLDSVVYFLNDSRRGHCELFASALAALCRSIDIPARVITGFVVTEYNDIGGYYVVRDRHAHAWTEVHAGNERGWITLDPTPPAEVALEHQQNQGLWSTMVQVYEHVEFAWINGFVTFDDRLRAKMLATVKQGLNATSAAIMRPIRLVRQNVAIWWTGLNNNDRTARITLGVAIMMIMATVIGLLINLALQHRRRVAALQLGGLPRVERRALSRELNFYLRMLGLLERKGHHRPVWQSPFAFAESLADRDPMRFDPVIALTEVFYEIRFGGRRLSESRRQRVRAHLRQLEANLGTNRDPAPTPTASHETLSDSRNHT